MVAIIERLHSENQHLQSKLEKTIRVIKSLWLSDWADRKIVETFLSRFDSKPEANGYAGSIKNFIKGKGFNMFDLEKAKEKLPEILEILSQAQTALIFSESMKKCCESIARHNKALDDIATLFKSIYKRKGVQND